MQISANEDEQVNKLCDLQKPHKEQAQKLNSQRTWGKKKIKNYTNKKKNSMMKNNFENQEQKV